MSGYKTAERLEKLEEGLNNLTNLSVALYNEVMAIKKKLKMEDNIIDTIRNAIENGNRPKGYVFSITETQMSILTKEDIEKTKQEVRDVAKELKYKVRILEKQTGIVFEFSRENDV